MWKTKERFYRRIAFSCASVFRRTRVLLSKYRKNKNSKKVAEIQKEIDTKKQQIIDISKNSDIAFSLYYTSSYAIENINKIKETLNKDERSVSVLSSIEANINLRGNKFP